MNLAVVTYADERLFLLYYSKMSQKINSIADIQSLLTQEWYNALKNEFNNDYWKGIITKLNNTKSWLPIKKDLFNALNHCSPNKVKAVIIGQDPYVHRNEACGYSFSVPNGTSIPPSLRNVYKELSLEYGMNTVPTSGCLESWANDGVLLLNSVLTVEEGKRDSHKNIGWENFTAAVIRYVDLHNKCVFLAWGRAAQQIVEKQVQNNQILVAGHPSPVNQTHPFVGCNCFRECNEILKSYNLLPIRWLSVYN